MARTSAGHCSKKMEADEQPSSAIPELCVGDDSAAKALFTMSANLPSMIWEFKIRRVLFRRDQRSDLLSLPNSPNPTTQKYIISTGTMDNTLNLDIDVN